MEYVYEPSGSVDGLREVLGRFSHREGIGALFVLAAVGNGFAPDTLDPVLREAPLPVFGGIFPRILEGAAVHERGSIVIALPGNPRIGVINALSEPGEDTDTLLDRLFPDNLAPGGTMLVYVDGFSANIGELVESLFNVFGLEINYLGGGTGDLDDPRRATVITPGGLLRDSAVLVYLEQKSGVGVRHGWRSSKGPFKVTQSDRQRIITLDWESAWNVYVEAVRKITGETMTEENFQAIAAGHPFGIGKIDAEKVVRDPYKGSPEEGISCVGDVPEGCFVDILSGEAEDLIRAAVQARTDAAATIGSRAGFCLVMDCISRFLYLGEAFPRELAAIMTPGLGMAGALTVGEVANNGKSFLEFYNKTAVVGLLEG